MNYVYDKLSPELKEIIWQINIHPRDIGILGFPNSFWSEVLEVYAEITFHEPQNAEEVLNQVIWYNSHMRIGNAPIKVNKELIDRDIIFVHDLVKENGLLMSYAEVTAKVGREILSWIWYSSLITAIPRYWKILLKDPTEELIAPKRIHYHDIIRQPKCSSFIYNYIIENKYEANMYKYMEGWNVRLNTNIDLESFLKLFVQLYKITDITKLRNFQYRLLLNKIFVNETLFKWKIVKSEECELCKRHKQSITHLLYSCPQIIKIWQFVQKLTGVNKFTAIEIIFNNTSSKINNLLILCVKDHIFQQKCLGQIPTVNSLKSEFKFVYSFNRKMASKNNRLKAFNKM